MLNTRESEGEPKSKKKKSIKNFQIGWLEIPEYKQWLKQVKGDNTKAYCQACRTTVLCGKSELEKHRASQKHIENIKQKNTTPSLITFLRKPETSHDKNVKRVEIKLAAFFAENVAFNTVEHLTPLLKEIFPDSKICKDIKLGRKKATYILNNVLSTVQYKNVTEILKSNNFSILLDESTDISSRKNFCFIARFIDPANSKVRSELVKLLDIDAIDCSSEALYNNFKSILIEKEIPLKNICGLGCDNASVMTGKHNSFYSRLKRDVPNAVLLRCICHSGALVASKSSHHIPDECEILLKNIVNYISHSVKSLSMLTEFQNYFNVENRKLLSPAQTRWLARQPAIKRLLENWVVLEHMFLHDSIESTRSSKAKLICEIMEDKRIKAYFLFLEYILNYFNSFNALLQSEKLLIHKLYTECTSLLRKISVNFVRIEFIDSLENIASLEDKHSLPETDIYVGLECEKYLNTLEVNHQMDVRKKVKKFYISSLNEMKQRLPFNNEIFKELEFLNPEIALDYSKRINSKTLNVIAKLVDCDESNLDMEWRNLAVNFPKDESHNLRNLMVEEFWKMIADAKDLENNPMFKI